MLENETVGCDDGDDVCEDNVNAETRMDEGCAVRMNSSNFKSW